MTDLTDLARSALDQLNGQAAAQVLIMRRLNAGQSLFVDEDGYMDFRPSLEEFYCDFSEVLSLEKLGWVSWIDFKGFVAQAVTNGDTQP